MTTNINNKAASTFLLLILILVMGFSRDGLAQTKYIDRNGNASFFSSAPLEDIEAHTSQAVSVVDVSTGEIAASMLMRSFRFRKSLMQEHFNENYIESHKYPKATFRGKISNMSELDLNKDGTYKLDIDGEITIHGVTKPLQIKADAAVNNGTLQAKAVFPLKVKDFDIKIPRLVIQNIAEEVEVTVSFNYKPMGDL
jgi:polyisoprenoid-binding protein YceI